MIMIVTMAMMV